MAAPSLNSNVKLQESMRILTYKRTHTGDPDFLGRFGINNCMGRVRGWKFDAVIGVGGIGAAPQNQGIEGRVTWVGRNPSWQPHPLSYGQIVTFEQFVLLESNGPSLLDLAPFLARRMYERGARVLFKSYSSAEKAEAESIVNILLGNGSASTASKQSLHRCRTKRAARSGDKLCVVE